MPYNSERVAGKLGSLPVLGPLFRLGERLSGNAGRKAVEGYRRKLSEHGDDEK